MSGEKRQICEKDKPWDGVSCASHPDAKCIDSYDSWEEGESYDKYKCPHCGVVFKEYTSK